MQKAKEREIFSKLKKSGHRLTAVRRSLVEFILRKKGHWTIQDLGNEVRKTHPKIGVATVYRTVSLLLKENLLTETRFGGASARYEVSGRHHHDHLTCLVCGEIFEFENDRIERIQSEIARRLGFRLSDHRMELFGDCLKAPCKYRPSDRAKSVTQRQNAATKA